MALSLRRHSSSECCYPLHSVTQLWTFTYVFLSSLPLLHPPDSRPGQHCFASRKMWFTHSSLKESSLCGCWGGDTWTWSAPDSQGNPLLCKGDLSPALWLTFLQRKKKAEKFLISFSSQWVFHSLLVIQATSSAVLGKLMFLCSLYELSRVGTFWHFFSSRVKNQRYQKIIPTGIDHFQGACKTSLWTNFYFLCGGQRKTLTLIPENYLSRLLVLKLSVKPAYGENVFQVTLFGWLSVQALVHHGIPCFNMFKSLFPI